MNKCEQCGKEFEGYGKNCNTCRSRLSRKSVAIDNATEVLNATENLATEPVASEPVAEVIGKNECDYETKVKYGRKYWENPAYLKTASKSMLLTILNVCYTGQEWLNSKAAHIT